MRADAPPKAVYDAALADYKAQRYERAAEGFERAYAITGTPLLLFNIGQSWRKLGELAKARDAYAHYLSAMPADDTSDTVREARDHLANIEAALGAHPPATAPPATTTKPPEIVAPPVTPTTADAKPAATQPAASPAVALEATTKTPEPKKRPVVKNPWLWSAVAVGVITLGLGVGLGVGLAHHGPPSSSLGSQMPQF